MKTSAPTEEDFPAVYVAADASSKEAQRRFKRAASARLVLLVTASAFGIWSLDGGADQVIASTAAVCFFSALLAEAYIWRVRPEQTWYEARAAAESAKTLAWRYAVGGEPFGKIAGPDPDAVLARQFEELTSDLAKIDLTPEIGSGRLRTEWMRATRESSFDNRKNVYEQHRVLDQQNWYTKRSRDHKISLDRWTRYLLAAEIIGIFVAVSRITGKLSIDPSGIVAAAAASIAAWIQTNQYRTLQTAYAVTALELGTLREAIESQTTEEEWSQFVEEAEKAFSREHTLWKASRGVQSL